VSVATLPVRHDAASAAVVRHELTSELRRLQIEPECIDDVVLVASELVANAVRHAAPVSARRIDVTWDFDATGVLIRVEDGSPTLPRRRRAGVMTPYGRGLAIVEAIAAEWGVELTARGKRVWARVPVHHTSNSAV
jgi:two-component sensor histidine kinase